MPRIFSKGLQTPDLLGPVGWATSKARNTTAEIEYPSLVSTQVITNASLDVDSCKLVCHPDLLPKRFEQIDPWCLPILRTEALLRLSEDYISQTQAYYDSGSVPPASLDEDVELEALRLHGRNPKDAAAYRRAARTLPIELRSDIFFLRANDRLFHPRAEVGQKKLTGTVHRIHSSDVREAGLEEMLDIPRALLVASTSS